uniref:DUF1409 domain-containing protein n=1 Tax=Oryza brachyantha TaxID=4533 RepID=J3LQ91_ORYBR
MGKAINKVLSALEETQLGYVDDDDDHEKTNKDDQFSSLCYYATTTSSTCVMTLEDKDVSSEHPKSLKTSFRVSSCGVHLPGKPAQVHTFTALHPHFLHVLHMYPWIDVDGGVDPSNCLEESEDFIQGLFLRGSSTRKPAQVHTFTAGSSANRLLAVPPNSDELLWVLWEFCAISRSDSGRQALLTLGFFPEAVSVLLSSLSSYNNLYSIMTKNGGSPLGHAIFHSAAEILEVLVADSTASSLKSWIGFAINLHTALHSSSPGSNRKDAPTRLLEWIDAGVVYKRNGAVGLLCYSAILAAGGDAHLSLGNVLVSDSMDVENVIADSNNTADGQVIDNILGKLVADKYFDGVALCNTCVVQLTTALRILAFISEDKGNLFPDEGIWLWKVEVPSLSAIRSLSTDTVLGCQVKKHVNWYLHSEHVAKLLVRLMPQLDRPARAIDNFATSSLKTLFRAFCCEIHLPGKLAQLEHPLKGDRVVTTREISKLPGAVPFNCVHLQLHRGTPWRVSWPLRKTKACRRRTEAATVPPSRETLVSTPVGHREGPPSMRSLSWESRVANSIGLVSKWMCPEGWLLVPEYVGSPAVVVLVKNSSQPKSCDVTTPTIDTTIAHIKMKMIKNKVDLHRQDQQPKESLYLATEDHHPYVAGEVVDERQNGVRHNRMLEKIASKRPETTGEFFELADRMAQREDAWAWNPSGSATFSLAMAASVPREDRWSKRQKKKSSALPQHNGKAIGGRDKFADKEQSADKWCSVDNTSSHSLAECRSVTNLAERVRQYEWEEGCRGPLGHKPRPPPQKPNKRSLNVSPVWRTIPMFISHFLRYKPSTFQDLTISHHCLLLPQAPAILSPAFKTLALLSRSHFPHEITKSIAATLNAPSNPSALRYSHSHVVEPSSAAMASTNSSPDTPYEILEDQPGFHPLLYTKSGSPLLCLGRSGSRRSFRYTTIARPYSITPTLATGAPTTNFKNIAEHLADGNHVPLGQYLLGAVYHMLYQVSSKLSIGQPVGHVAGPWWFLQLWLRLYFSKVLDLSAFDQRSFPSLSFIESEPAETQRCMSYGEIVSSFLGHRMLAVRLAHIFKLCYLGQEPNACTWFAYPDSRDYEAPNILRLDEILAHKCSLENLAFALTPCLLSVSFHSGRSAQPSYEFYHPSLAARQLGCGQLPANLFFLGKIEIRRKVTLALEFDRISKMAEVIPFGSMTSFGFGVTILDAYTGWWEELHQHLFSAAVGFFCNRIDSDNEYSYFEPTHAVHVISQSGRRIEYSTSMLSAIGHVFGTTKSAEKADRAPKKKLKITTEAIPLETTSADMDAAIDAAAGDDSDIDVREKSPVKSSDDAISVPTDASDPTPTTGAVPIPPNILRLDEILAHKCSLENLAFALTPCLLSVSFHSGRSAQPSYEFYHPSLAARQLGCGQLPANLFFLGKIEIRRKVTLALEFDRISKMAEVIPFGSMTSFGFGVTILDAYTGWWEELHQHLFSAAVGFFCNRIDSDNEYSYFEPTHAVHVISQSGRRIEYSTSMLSAIGHVFGTTKSAEKADRAPKKKLKITTEAIPLETTSADMDAAIDAAAGDDSDIDVREKSPVKSSDDAISVPTDASDPTPTTGAVPIPPSPTPAPSPAGPALKSRKKHKMVVHRPSRRITSSTQLAGALDTAAPPVDADPAPAPVTEEALLASTPPRPTNVAPMAQLTPMNSLICWLTSEHSFKIARLDYPIDTLINDVGPIRCRIEEIQDQLPNDLVDSIAPTGYIESHQIPVLQAQQRISDHASQAVAQAQV